MIRAVDGFRTDAKNAFVGYSPDVARRFLEGLDRFGRKLRIGVDGLDRLPAGRALLVANHAFGWDVAFAMARIQKETGRRVFALGEHAWWVVPGLRRLAAAVGTVDGTPENADRLLAGGELVLVLPGGLRESMKPRELRYRLLWEQRYGFVRAAVRTQAPIVPLASLGPDDLFDLVGDAFARARRFHLPFPLPRPALFLPLPHRVPWRFVVGEPIPTEGVDLDDAHALRRLRREVEGSLHEIFEDRLAERVGFRPHHHRGRPS